MPAKHSTHDATLPNGFPLLVHVTWHPAEPDVGIFYPQPEITKIECLSRAKRKDGTKGKTRVKPFWRDLTKEEEDFVLDRLEFESNDMMDTHDWRNDE